jgi:hypothetical protein
MRYLTITEVGTSQAISEDSLERRLQGEFDKTLHLLLPHERFANWLVDRASEGLC